MAQKAIGQANPIARGLADRFFGLLNSDASQKRDWLDASAKRR